MSIMEWLMVVVLSALIGAAVPLLMYGLVWLIDEIRWRWM